MSSRSIAQGIDEKPWEYLIRRTYCMGLCARGLAGNCWWKCRVCDRPRTCGQVCPEVLSNGRTKMNQPIIKNSSPHLWVFILWDWNSESKHSLYWCICSHNAISAIWFFDCLSWRGGGRVSSRIDKKIHCCTCLPWINVSCAMSWETEKFQIYREMIFFCPLDPLLALSTCFFLLTGLILKSENLRIIV